MSKMSKTAIALFDCVSDSLSELTFKENDLITNVTETQEDGWFHGVLIRTGQVHFFNSRAVYFPVITSNSPLMILNLLIKKLLGKI